jgi:hypothetical protein
MKKGRAKMLKLATSVAFLYLIGVLSMPTASPARPESKQSAELARPAHSKGWKLCGTFHLTRATDVNLEAKHYSCLQSLEVIAQMIVEPGLNECGDGCEAKGFKCHSPGAIQGGIGGAGNGFICVKGAARVRLKGVTRHH